MAKKNELPLLVRQQKELVEYVKGLTDLDLVTVFKSYWATIYKVDSFSYKDMVMFHRIEAEVRKRGYCIFVACSVDVRKPPLDIEDNEDFPKHTKG